MMRLMRYLLVIGLLIAIPQPMPAESDIAGWGKARWGMTHAALKKLYGLTAWQPGNLPSCKSKSKIRILGRDFAVAFYFDERSSRGKLFKVVLVHFNAVEKDGAWIDSVKDLLVEKYGNPLSFEVKDNMKISRWMKSAGRLKLTTVTGQTVMCAMEYMSVSLAAEKL